MRTDKSAQAIASRDYLLANVTPNTAKRVLTNVNACCDWAMRSQLIDHNPFRDMAGDVYLSKGDVEEADINPFTAEERDAIIQAFQESQLYGYYASLVQVLFFTGCRPSEAMVKDRPKGPTRFSGSISTIASFCSSRPLPSAPRGWP